MQRLTISLDDDIATAFDALIERQGYKNRSEAFRDLLRERLARETIGQGEGQCVAVVSYAYDHHKRQISSRMVERQHDHTSLVISTMHVHVSHDNCVESVVMKGPVGQVLDLARETVAQTGVEHGQINVIPCGEQHDHDHDPGHEHHH
ncbi:MAG TPA: nickel-responsive transcriptional regulator NikR [Sutterella sp.]|jgi:CopG family nickel-responsive transcriptional regulator|nr:nickel-responsive transcriptional regulator NikR [Sutterella sp.]